ncbi:purple acid phosphatase family protein [Portibacter lacus]|uniref:Phosphoesterase n=1 Tax=Portibacter lacus TaxID=1099794 RepID=A0AA37SML6_9BACT|nr:metallophosphoesterase family protein [Portibacter lacus]GLR16577.1 phosphoesterase [Portibacter lacus]
MKNFLPLFAFLLVLNLGYAQIPKVYKAPVYEKEWNHPTIHPDRIMVNFGAEATSELNITWRTSTDVKQGIVEIAKATAAPKFWRNANTHNAELELFDLKLENEIEVSAHYHSVKIKDLEANTLYAYRVGDGMHWSEWIHVKTANTDPDRFSFIYIGDAQNNVLEVWSRLIRQGFQKAPDAAFMIHAGDLINHANTDLEWEEWFQAGSFIHSMIPSFPVPGNHEYRSIKDGEPRQLSVLWRPQFTLPENGPEGLEETVYYMDYQDLRVIGLNSNEQKEKQMIWLEDVLKNNSNKWTVVTFHHPLFSASSSRDNDEWREMLKPILDKYQVDLALQGHDHAYSRGRTTPLEENIPTGVNAKDLTGTVYVVSVSGGKMYSLRPNAWEGWDADRDRAAENTQLFQVLTVDGNILKYESYTATGDLYDAFEVIKNIKGPNSFVELKGQAISGRYFDNTIAYPDQLPADIEKNLISKHEGFFVTRVAYQEKENDVVYKVRISNGETKYDMIIDLKGNVVTKEEVE